MSVLERLGNGEVGKDGGSCNGIGGVGIVCVRKRWRRAHAFTIADWPYSYSLGYATLGLGLDESFNVFLIYRYIASVSLRYLKFVYAVN